jgi:NAD+ diphosphatase
MFAGISIRRGLTNCDTAFAESSFALRPQFIKNVMSNTSTGSPQGRPSARVNMKHHRPATRHRIASPADDDNQADLLHPAQGFQSPSGHYAQDLRTILDLCGPETRFIPVVNSALILRYRELSGKAVDGHVELVSWPAQQVENYLDCLLKSDVSPGPADVSFALLSWWRGRRYVAFNISCMSEAIINLPQGERPTPLRRCMTLLLDSAQVSLACQAKCAIEWHQCNRFCGLCGHAMVIAGNRGMARRCVNSGCPKYDERVYTRINPSVIVLVTRSKGAECLLGRKASWPRGKFSALAGFCEIGESLENAVEREVTEESGVVVDPRSIRYHSSQPWPHPSASVLSAFYANALDTTIRLLDNELESAMWVGREWLRRELNKEPREAKISIPGPRSIAHTLIVDWISDAGSAQLANESISGW